ncbi:MAG TPA: sigma-70 family RNA polymerase sigma factor [Puia sp.]
MNEVIAIKQGSEPVFASIYQRFHSKVFRFLLRRVKEPEVAKELTQQVFIKLWQSRHTLSELHPVESQLMTISGSILVDHLRKQVNEYRMRATLVEKLSAPQLAAGGFPAVDFEHSDYLNAVIEKLPPVRKKIMRLRMINGLSNKEIASQLDISSKTVEDHITKALRHVRSIVSSLFLLLFLY